LPSGKETRPPIVYWIWGESGVGKSYIAREALPNAWDFLNCSDSLIYDTVHSNEDTIADNIYSDTFGYYEFLGLLNNSNKTRHIIITSICPPEECFKNYSPTQLQNTLRHLSYIIEIQQGGNLRMRMLAVAEEAKTANGERQYRHIFTTATDCELLFGHLSKLTTIEPQGDISSGDDHEISCEECEECSYPSGGGNCEACVKYREQKPADLRVRAESARVERATKKAQVQIERAAEQKQIKVQNTTQVAPPGQEKLYATAAIINKHLKQIGTPLLKYS
jgi:hypothetical protein